MTFDEAVEALDALASEGVVVDASAWGIDPRSAPLMSQGGVLRRIAPRDELADLIRDAAGEEAVVFVVGQGSDHTFSLWPSRFVGAEADDLNGIAIATRDGRLHLRRNRAWID